MPRAYRAIIISSKSGRRRWPLATSTGSKLLSRSWGISSSISSVSVFSPFVLFPFREFPPFRPSDACFSYPRCAVISPSSTLSYSRFVRSSSTPPDPTSSSGFLPSNSRSRSSSTLSSLLAMGPPFQSIYSMAFHTEIWTLPREAPAPCPGAPAATQGPLLVRGGRRRGVFIASKNREGRAP
jgi:hypothetical protein